MSLLMQALKKAERAKQNAADEPELDRPSQAFDEVLELTPTPAAEPAAASPGSAPARQELRLDFAPSPDFSLEPLRPEPPAASLTPRPAPDPLPASSDHGAPGLTLDLAPDPAAPHPQDDAAQLRGAGLPSSLPQAHGAPPPAQPSAPTDPSDPTAADGFASGAAVGAATAGAAARPAPAGASATRAEAMRAGSRAEAAGTAAGADHGNSGRASAAQHGNSGGNGGSGAGARARSAARARAASAAAEPPGMDPERLRLIGLLTLLALIVIGFGFYYWQAVMAPGAGARLPPVPMPPPGATGATPGQLVSAAPAAGAAATADGDASGLDNPDPSAGGMLAPSINRRAREDIERRLARTEQELAAAQQAIQQQAQAAAAPRPERLPPVAAPESAEIRVARAVQPAPVAPALQTAYSALASGDLVNARQQYEAALRQDGNNRDALLGLASVAVRQHDSAQASAAYLRLLELDPNDATAVAGLVGLRGSDPGQSERRLKAILASNPDAGPVLFALGNVYAQGSRWSEAQQAYFRAYTAAPDNPDYAYNLAIGLDRLNQGPLALSYYQRALALAQDKAAAFDRAALRQRMHELGGAR